MGEGGKYSTQGQAHKNRRVDFFKQILISFLITGLIAYLFYDSIYGIFLIIPIFFIVKKFLLENKKNKFKEQILKEYKEFLNGLSEWIAGGISVEGAFLKEEEELNLLFGKNSFLLPYIKTVNAKIKLNNSIENAFFEFAEKINIEEIREFAGIFVFVKRLGGDYSKNIRSAAEKIGRRVEIKEEIEVITTEKRLEMIIMSVIPLGIILFLKISAKDFISPLYHSIFGVFVMTISLLVYALSVYMAIKIIKVE